MNRGPKIINVRARDLKNPVEGLETERQNRIVIERDVLPIIFIPGIMGSRLKNAQGKKVWDPDKQGFMLLKYGGFWCSAKKRKQRVIGEQFSPEHLEVLDDDAEQVKRIADSGGKDKTRKERGWGGVSWSTYGDILKALQKRLWDPTVNLFFEFPVHVFGYNWTASNDLAGKKLAEEIDKIIKKYTDMDRHCDYVILVTHSMGGLVARSAYMLHGAKDKILGIVHGVQPSNGSPAAYWRMKGGFERPHSFPQIDPMQWFKNPVRIFKQKTNKLAKGLAGTVTAWTLGTDGKEVTALLGNMPGGLELLPNKRYTNNDGSAQWLELIDGQGKRKALPKSDPYTEIYEQDDVYYRLVNPEWLNPGGNKTDKSKWNDVKTGWVEYLKYLAQAKTFHANLSEKEAHPDTYQFYSSGIASADRIVFTSADDTLRNTVNAKLGIGKSDAQNRSVKDLPQWMILGSIKGVMDVMDSLVDWYASRGGYRAHLNMEDELISQEGRVHIVRMQLPDGAGDGTVPESSGMALKLASDKKRTFCIADLQEFESTFGENSNRLRPKNPPDFDEGYFDRGHEGIYKTSTARFITFTCIENICRKEIGKLVER